VLPADGRGSLLDGSGDSSEATQRVLDEEVRQLIDTAHLEVTTTLTAHRERLETLAQALLKDETLDELDAYAAAQMPPRNPDADETASLLIAGDETPKRPQPEAATDATLRTARGS